jgi:hypothetical protein
LDSNLRFHELWVFKIWPGLGCLSRFASYFFSFVQALFSRFILHYLFNWRLGFFFFSLLFCWISCWFWKWSGYLKSSILSFFIWFFLVNSLNLCFFPNPFFQYFKWFSKIIYTVIIIFPFHSPLFFFHLNLVLILLIVIFFYLR